MSKELLQSIYSEPESWELDAYVFSRGRDSIWIANGVFFVESYETANLHFGFLDKFRFWKAYKWWCHNRPLPSMEKKIAL